LVILHTPALGERELAKTAALGVALAAALTARGGTELQAILAARTAMAPLAQATISWLDDPGLGLGQRLDIALSELKALVT
jgi:hypothetical protein